ncbi:MAG: polyprenyl synthetase family protein [Firmicutes bacterium]|nr:polyprenyl synthetase family protein [Bacillota bacterium]
MSDIVKIRQNEWLPKIETALNDAVSTAGSISPELEDAVKYSLLDAGKRIRPILALEFCRAAGGNPEDAMPFGCGVEMIHTYSLIHDDLPCMDDDDLRRGKPSCHVKFGEDTALLAGDALQPLAFETMLTQSKLSPERTVKAAAVLAHACGAAGMVGGQVIDLGNEGKQVGLDELRKMDAGKTGAIIKAACVMGVIAADGDENTEKIAELYAENIGIAFQITDDILDITSDEATLGKPVASDIENSKSTYVSLLGLDKAKREAERYTELAVEAVAPLGDKADFLIAFARMLANRIN